MRFREALLAGAVGALATVTSALAQPATSPTSAPQSTDAPSATDRAYALVGAWSCRSAYGSTGKLTFVRNADDSIAMTNHYQTIEKQRGTWSEVYRFNAATGEWTWNSSLDYAPIREGGTALPWTKSPSWMFTGTISEGSVTIPDSIVPIRQPVAPETLRMVYTLQDDGTLARRFDVYSDGAWATTSASTCSRIMPAS